MNFQFGRIFSEEIVEDGPKNISWKFETIWIWRSIDNGDKIWLKISAQFNWNWKHWNVYLTQARSQGGREVQGIWTPPPPIKLNYWFVYMYECDTVFFQKIGDHLDPMTRLNQSASTRKFLPRFLQFFWLKVDWIKKEKKPQMKLEG